MIPEVAQTLTEIRTIHEKKNADYTEVGSAYQNFDRAASVISWFKDDNDKTYVNHIAAKLARLAVLLSSNQSPNNESISDSFLDLCTYCVLWRANYLYRKFTNKTYGTTINVPAATEHPQSQIPASDKG